MVWEDEPAYYSEPDFLHFDLDVTLTLTLALALTPPRAPQRAR